MVYMAVGIFLRDGEITMRAWFKYRPPQTKIQSSKVLKLSVKR